ncbi:hypothetical protein BDV26DRAFT_103579 [Aspergillus bertholletiae]|uniref:Uncharacterized protein n=1 Tax=Aspergillus bertholletiae TaxID=1226010 RepID=A0A5N7AR35_9EURO|nr:hypothetical protein BDV26DRAFT_103579 [Aspergillus bertholletiae]
MWSVRGCVDVGVRMTYSHINGACVSGYNILYLRSISGEKRNRAYDRLTLRGRWIAEYI